MDLYNDIGDWLPKGEDRKYVELVTSMGVNCLSGRGVDTRETFAMNLRLIAEYFDPKE